MSPLLAAILAIGACAGIALVIGGLIGQEDTAAPKQTSTTGRLLAELVSSWNTSTRRAQLLAAAIATPATWLFTGIPVFGLAVGAAILGVPLLLGKAEDGGGVARLEGLEAWTRALASVLTVGPSIEQAILQTSTGVAASIQEPVSMLAARIGARWDTAAAVRMFADDLNDGAGDMVAGALILGIQERVRGLAAVLSGLATTLHQEVQARRSVETDRAKPRAVARAVTLLFLFMLVVQGLRPSWRDGYSSLLGQLLLTLWLSVFAGALITIRVMTRGKPTPRFLRPFTMATSRLDETDDPAMRTATTAGNS